MSLKKILTESGALLTLLGILVAGFTGVWLGMQDMGNNIRGEIAAMRAEISTLSQRVARIEGRLHIPAAPAGDRAASDRPRPDSDHGNTGQPSVDG